MSLTAVYALLGGMISVVITDLAQFFIMLVCSLIIAGIAMAKIAPAEFQALLPAGWHNIFFGWKLDLDWSQLIPSLSQNLTQDGYSFFGFFFIAMVFKGLLVSIAGPAPNYDMQRILAARNPREASFMSALVSVCLFPRWILVAGITALGIQFLSPVFRTQSGRIDFEMVLPFVIKEFIPVGLIGLLLAGLLAAFMSTFSATLNAGGAYLVNDLYKRYVKSSASSRHYVAVSYVAQTAIIILGFSFGFMTQSVNQVTQWIVNGLWGGYTAANVLKWHWYRLNGFGYFWGMLAGIGSALTVPQFFPNSGLGSLAGFPIILGISALGCVAGSLLTAPEEEEILKRFYIQVRPWGFWGPIQQAVARENPSFKPNRNFLRDMLNCGVAMVWQVPLWAIPIYVVFRSWKALWISILVLLATSVFLKYNWLDKMEKETGTAKAPEEARDAVRAF
jgi:Na+/proline symporter